MYKVVVIFLNFEHFSKQHFRQKKLIKSTYIGVKMYLIENYMILSRGNLFDFLSYFLKSKENNIFIIL